MITVKAFPHINSGHTDEIFAGLWELHHGKRLRVRYGFRDPLGVSHAAHPVLYRNILSALVRDLSKNIARKICFDLNDGPEIETACVRACDHYFKRGFDPRSLKRLDPHLRRKVLPYGLNYQCRSQHEKRNTLKRLIRFCAADTPQRLRMRSMQQMVRNFAVRRLAKGTAAYAPSNDRSLLISDLEAGPDVVVEPLVLYQVKIYDPESLAGRPVAEFKRLMDERANLVRALKRAFGKQFIGGVLPTDYARKHYADCISTFSPERRSYLRLVRGCLIGVATTGLHDSAGWKLAEYFAGSKCIVSKPLKYVLPRPLVEGEHYLTFDSANECVRSCVRILDDSDLVHRMRRANYHYYRSQIRPPQKIWSCIQRTLACEDNLQHP